MLEKNVSNSEWYVLECLWESAPKTLMQIVEECREKAGWAKSTTATMVKRMGEKGLIRYDESGKAKLFYPLVKRENVAIRQTREFLQRIYHGSVGIMMNTLAKQDSLTEKDLQELEEFLEQCRTEKNNK